MSDKVLSPHAERVKLRWQSMRLTVIRHFPPAPDVFAPATDYLASLDEMFKIDAYHSLTIEKYRVTPRLIETVMGDNWDMANPVVRNHKDAMAARGYWQAFQAVRKTVEKILNGFPPGEQVDTDHSEWFQKLFDPSVSANILHPSDLLGYRNHPVFIGGSKHVPFSVESMRDAMPVLFGLLKQEPEASVRAILGHFFFGYIHPYMDGNGRISRFLMNTMLASGNYPWTVVPVQQQHAYMQAIEIASTEQDIKPLTLLIAKLVSQSMKGKPVANLSEFR